MEQWLDWQKILKEAKSLLVTTHINPDPDALASGWGILSLVRHLKPEILAVFSFSGIIGREENRALVEKCRIPLTPWSEISLEDFDRIVLVDCQPGQKNHPLSIPPHVVLDHHPLQPLQGNLAYVDVRPEYGATSTLVYLYLKRYQVPLDSLKATALLYGIKTDTADLARSQLDLEFQLYMELVQISNRQLLREIQEAPLRRGFYLSLKNALERAEMWRDSILITSLVDLDYPEFPAQMADLLLRAEGVEWAIAMGFFDSTLYLSVRSGRNLDASKLVQEAIGDMGHAGGHGRAAGGQIPWLGEEKEELLKRVYSAFAQVFGVDLTREVRPFLLGG